MKTNKIKYAVLALSLVAGIVSAQSSRIVIEGSTTVLPISQAAAEVYMDKNKAVEISVKGGGSGIGVASLMDKTCDICQSSRPIKGSEIKSALANGVDPKSTIIAMDGIAVIINNQNSVSNISKKDLKAIYTGGISDWSKLGCNIGKIVVISRDSSSGTFEAFGELALGGAKVRANALLQASNQAVVTTVSKTPGAIGYCGLGYLSDAVKLITVNGVVCEKSNVLKGTYPLARPLFLYTNGKPEGAAKIFIDFLLGSEGQKIVEEQGFIALKK
jgi:phosphate transport system substrate-binding protein